MSSKVKNVLVIDCQDCQLLKHKFSVSNLRHPRTLLHLLRFILQIICIEMREHFQQHLMWNRDNESRGWLVLLTHTETHLLNFARSLSSYVTRRGQILVQAQNLIQFDLQKERLLERSEI